MKHQRIASAVKYASRTTGVDWEKWLTWGVIGGAGYLLYTMFTALKSAQEQLATVGSAIGSGLYDFFHRDQVGETLFYNVGFPDGSRHAVASRSVDSYGVFRNSGDGNTYLGDGKTYRLVRQKSNGLLFAIPV